MGSGSLSVSESTSLSGYVSGDAAPPSRLGDAAVPLSLSWDVAVPGFG